MEPLASSAGAYAFAVVLGLLWGSFANVCIYRWPPTDEHPNGRSVVAPGSHCMACKAPIRWYEVDDVAPDDVTLAPMPARYAELGDLHAGIDDAVFEIEQLLEWADRDDRDGAVEPPEPETD